MKPSFIAFAAMITLWTNGVWSQSHTAEEREKAELQELDQLRDMRDVENLSEALSQIMGSSYAQNIDSQSSYCKVGMRIVIDQQSHTVLDAWSLVKPSESLWDKAKSVRSINHAVSALRGLKLHRDLANLERNLFIKHFQTMSIGFPGDDCNLEQIDHTDAVAIAIEREESNYQSTILAQLKNEKAQEEINLKKIADLFGDDFGFVETETCPDLPISVDSKCGKLITPKNYQYPVSGFDSITFDQNVDRLSLVVSQECGRAHLWLHYPEGLNGKPSVTMTPYEQRYQNSWITGCYRLFGYLVDVSVGWSVYNTASSQTVYYRVDSPTRIQVRGFQKQDYKSGVRDATMDEKKVLFNDILDALKNKYPDYLVDKADQQINARYLFAGCSIVLHYRGFHRYTPFDSVEKYLEYLHPIFAKQECDAVRGKVEKRPKDVTL